MRLSIVSLFSLQMSTLRINSLKPQLAHPEVYLRENMTDSHLRLPEIWLRAHRVEMRTTIYLRKTQIYLAHL